VFQVLTESGARSPVGAEAVMLYVSPRPIRQALPTGINRTPAPSPAPPVWRPSIVAPDLSPPALPAALPTVADLLDGTGPRSSFESAFREQGPGDSTRPAGDLLTAETVDEPVAIVRQPVPRYPAALAQAGITGRVVLQYVVDTVGRAVPGSLCTLTSTHAAFQAAAHASVLAGRYRPARLRGKVVPQLVRQTLSFRLGDRP
jgi:TonB family protein